MKYYFKIKNLVNFNFNVLVFLDHAFSNNYKECFCYFFLFLKKVCQLIHALFIIFLNHNIKYQY